MKNIIKLVTIFSLVAIFHFFKASQISIENNNADTFFTLEVDRYRTVLQKANGCPEGLDDLVTIINQVARLSFARDNDEGQKNSVKSASEFLKTIKSDLFDVVVCVRNMQNKAALWDYIDETVFSDVDLISYEGDRQGYIKKKLINPYLEGLDTSRYIDSLLLTIGKKAHFDMCNNSLDSKKEYIKTYLNDLIKSKRDNEKRLVELNNSIKKEFVGQDDLDKFKNDLISCISILIPNRPTVNCTGEGEIQELFENILQSIETSKSYYQDSIKSDYESDPKMMAECIESIKLVKDQIILLRFQQYIMSFGLFFLSCCLIVEYIKSIR